MKKVILGFAVAISVLSACQTEDTNLLTATTPTQTELANVPSNRDQQEAIEIAQKFIKQNDSKKMSVSFLIEGDNNSRSGILDTLAYAINVKDNGGFALVAYNSNVEPILAFSEYGNFDVNVNEDHPVYENFIALLPAYINAHSQKSRTDADMSGSCVYKSNIISTGWHQYDPFDRYVIQDHPGCPVGCGAIAVGLLMHYCKNSLTYHGEYYDFKEIRKAMEGSTSSVMSYDDAIDRIAKMLYYIGQDVNMDYDPAGSGTYDTRCCRLIDNLGYINSGLMSYDPLAACWDLAHDYYVFMRGANANNIGGHFWILDGVQFCINGNKSLNDYTKEDIIDAYVRCDWGWHGDFNAFYKADVFTPGTSNYSYFNSYFSVKNETINPFDFTKP